MTKEEYLAATDIKSTKEAQKLLIDIQFLFVSVFVSLIIIKSLIGRINDGIYGLLSLVYLGLLVFFVTECMRVIKLTRLVTKAQAFWSVFFAPFSWFWFYPALTRPLKIILGKIAPPEKLPVHRTDEELKKIRKVADKKYWKTFAIVTAIFVILLGAVFVWMMVGVHDYQKISSDKVNDLSQKELGYHYTSIDSGFEADFPTAPTRQEHREGMPGELGTNYVTYEADKGDSIYYVMHYSFDDPGIDEKSPTYNVKSGLEGSVNGMVNGIKGSKLISSNFSFFLGHQAIDFAVDSNQKTVEGTFFFYGRDAYFVAVEYSNGASSKPDLEGFKSSFKLR